MPQGTRVTNGRTWPGGMWHVHYRYWDALTSAFGHGVSQHGRVVGKDLVQSREGVHPRAFGGSLEGPAWQWLVRVS